MTPPQEQPSETIVSNNCGLQPIPAGTPAESARRNFLGAAFTGMAGAAGVLAVSGDSAIAAQEAARPEIQSLFPKGAPAAAPGYSPGIAAKGTQVVFVSGQGPADLTVDMETQIRQTFDRIGLVLKAAGADFTNVVMLRAYFVNLKRDLPVYRKVRMEYLREPFPASTALATPELVVPGLEIEIEAVAIL